MEAAKPVGADTGAAAGAAAVAATDPHSHDKSFEEQFNWDTGEYARERRAIYGMDRFLVLGLAWFLSLIAILSALVILKRSHPHYSLFLQASFPSAPEKPAEVARALFFGGGAFLGWSSVLLLLEAIPLLLFAWFKRLRDTDVPGAIIAVYVHILECTWEVGAAVLVLAVANLANMLYPPPEAPVAPTVTVKGDDFSNESLADLLKRAESSEEEAKANEATLKALRVWLRMTTVVAKKEPLVDATQHLFSIVKNLGAMHWQTGLVRFTYLLSVFFTLKLLIKAIMSWTAAAFHKRTLQQRLTTNKQAIAITKRLQQRLLPSGKRLKHSELGLRLFERLCPRGMDFVSLDELKEFLPSDLAAVYMELIDLDGNGDISKEEFEVAVRGFYAERDNLSFSLTGNSKIVEQLSNLLSAVVWFISFLTMLVVLDETVSSTLKMVGGALLSLTFVFGSTAADAFQSILFILLSHPFDIGDSVSIDDKGYRVKELGLWTCSFIGPQNAIVYISNSAIRDRKISNTRRSGHQTETYKLKLSSAVTDKQLEQLEQDMRRWVAENDRDFEPDSFMVTQVVVMDRERVSLDMELTHKSNFQDGGVRRRRSRAFFFQLRDTLARLGIDLAKPLE